LVNVSVGRTVPTVMPPAGPKSVGAEALTIEPSAFTNVTAVDAALGDNIVWGVPEQATIADTHTTSAARMVFLSIEQVLLVDKESPHTHCAAAGRPNR
jgi:hypothetical protein